MFKIVDFKVWCCDSSAIGPIVIKVKPDIILDLRATAEK